MLPGHGRLPWWWAAEAGCLIIATSVCAASPPSQAAAASEAPRLLGWHVAEQPHLVVISDAGASTTAAVTARLLALQDVFASAWPSPTAPLRPVVVIAVRSGSTLRQWLSSQSPAFRHQRSAGVFVRGFDRDYLAMALDADTGRPYGALDHEYGHLLVDRHCERLPWWLDEGLAEVVANGLTGRDTADRATAIAQLLRLEPLIPLRDLLSAGRASDHDTDSRRTALFYAQAWTFVHYMLVADSGARAPRLSAFMTQLMRGAADIEAAEQGFGDLASVEAAWTRYVRTGAFAYIRPPLPRFHTARVAATRLAPGDAGLFIGDFLAHSGSTGAAVAMLRAASADNRSSQAAERIALAHLVARDFTRAEAGAVLAIRREPRWPIARYVRAVAVMAQSGVLSPEQVQQTEQDLRIAVEGNPQLARAHAVLGGLLAVARGQTTEGLDFVRRAIAIDPSDFANRIALAQVLLLDGQHDEVRWLATHIVARAAVEEERAVGERLLRLASQAAPKQVQQADEQQPP